MCKRIACRRCGEELNGELPCLRNVRRTFVGPTTEFASDVAAPDQALQRNHKILLSAQFALLTPNIKLMEREAQHGLAQVEQARQQLEDQIAKLRKSLQYWQTWEAEYEGFKEELEALGEDAGAEDIIDLANNFGGTVITKKEIQDLLRFGHASHRSRSQLLDNISKRVETGQKNAESVVKQLDRAEIERDRMESRNVTSAAPEETPVMEIYEELDDQDNVVSSRLVNANEGSSAFDAALRDDSKRKEHLDSATRSASRVSETKKDLNFLPASTVSNSAVPQPVAKPPASGVSGLKKPGLASLGGQRIYELDEDENILGSSIIQPITATVEDVAQHRAEVFENVNHLGPVVATMDLNDDSEFSDGNYLDEDDDDEIAGGSRVVGYDVEDLKDTGWEMDDDREEFSPEYIQEMEALMRKYNEPLMANVGPQDAGFPLAKELNPPVPKPTPPVEDNIRDEPAKPEKPPKAQKGVRFADNLDIASGPPTSTANAPVETAAVPFRPKTSTSEPIVSDIVERAPAPITSTADVGGKKKISRFKASRGS